MRIEPAIRSGLRLAGLLLPLWAASAVAADVIFSDATPSSGIDYRNVCGAAPGAKGWLAESMGAGAAWIDYDSDGNLDLYVVNGSSFTRAAGSGEPNRLYRGDGRGGFTDVTVKAGVGHRGWGLGVATGDIDNDGDPDLYLTNLGPNVLYRNRGDGTFEDIVQPRNRSAGRPCEAWRSGWGAPGCSGDPAGHGWRCQF